MSQDQAHTHPVTAVRRFNRFYTSAIGVLDRRYLGSPYGVAEGRVLYEVATGERVTPKQVSEITRIDPGYLSRILGRLERDGMVARWQMFCWPWRPPLLRRGRRRRKL